MTLYYRVPEQVIRDAFMVADQMIHGGYGLPAMEAAQRIIDYYQDNERVNPIGAAVKREFQDLGVEGV